MLLPYQHPLCAFPCPQNISHQRFHQAGTRHCRWVWVECSCPAVPALLPWGRGR